LEDSFVKIVQLELSFTVHDLMLLLLAEKLPNTCNGFKVILSYFVEVSLT